MINLLNQIIEEIDGPITLLDESFSNETISDKILSNSRFYKCEFDNVVFRKSEFSQCRFQNCQILESDLTRIEFDNSSFTSCESGSLFANVQFSETKFEEILLIGLILSYPVRIHKLKKVRQNSFQEILADFYLE